MIYAITALFCIAAIEGAVIVLLWRKTGKASETAARLVRTATETCLKTAMEYHNQDRLEISLVGERISNLEKGAIPDYEKAKEAAQWMDKFNEAVTGYLSYDPVAAIRNRKEGDTR